MVAALSHSLIGQVVVCRDTSFARENPNVSVILGPQRNNQLDGSLPRCRRGRPSRATGPPPRYSSLAEATALAPRHGVEGASVWTPVVSRQGAQGPRQIEGPLALIDRASTCTL